MPNIYKANMGDLVMYLMYVDESGDAGLINSPSNYYILSDIVVHELDWIACLQQLVTFRVRMKDIYGLRMNEEIHAYEMMGKPGPLSRILKHNRLAILRHFLDELNQMSEISVINVVVDKQSKQPNYDVFYKSWIVLLQRFENTIHHGNFPGSANPEERGMVFSDATNDGKLRQILRQARRYNPIPNHPFFGLGTGYRNLQMTHIIEDPNMRDSTHSYFVQAADTISYFLKQKLHPSSYIRRKHAQNYFDRVDNILCKVASRTDAQGIVFI